MIKPRNKIHKYQAVVVGVSFGGLKALKTILPVLTKDFPAPVIVVQHHGPQADDFLARFLDDCCQMQVKAADEKEKVKPGTVYIAPANYHLLIEDNQTLSLSVEEKINFARPAIDVLFDSAADVFKKHLIGVILTGANNDGSQGLKKIKDFGGITVVQDPETAEAPGMPEAAIAATEIDYLLPLEEIGSFLNLFITNQCNRQKVSAPCTPP